MTITIVLYIIILSYCLAIIVLIYGFTKVNTIEYTGVTPKTKFSIIVPFRNEAENLPVLLESLSKLNYPMELFEVILVDDESKESFEVQDLKFKISIIKNIRVSNSPKKDAIVTAMQIVTTDWIITTDADCVVNGNDSIASGDDVFLLQKAIAKSPEKVHYLKSQNNIVTTKPLDDWKSLFYQRVRWASKTSSYQSTFGKGLGVLVFAGNLGLIVGVGCWVLGGIPFQNIVLLFLLKFLVDTVLIYKANYFLTKTKIQYLILSSLLYPFFSVSVALYSLFGKYEWKGRKF